MFKTARKTNEWVLKTAGVERSLLTSVKERKLGYYGHVMRKEGDLEKAIIQGTTPGSRARGRPRTTWMNNITEWTGLSVDQLVRRAQDRQQWRAVVHDAASPRSIEAGSRQDNTRRLTMVLPARAWRMHWHSMFRIAQQEHATDNKRTL